MRRDWKAAVAQENHIAATFLAAAAAAHRRDWVTVERLVRPMPDPHHCGSMLEWYLLTPPETERDWVALEALLCTATEGVLIALKDLRARAGR